MEKLQSERNELLLYVLQNPPSYVTVVLPEGARFVTELDLTRTPSPLAAYAAATASNPVEVRVASQHVVSSGSGTEGELGKCGSVDPDSGSSPKVKKSRFRWKNLQNYFMAHLRGGSQPLCSPERTPSAVSPRLDTVGPSAERRPSLHMCVVEPCLTGECSASQPPACGSSPREPLPLEGSQGYSLVEYVAPFLCQAQGAVSYPLDRPALPVIELCPVVSGGAILEFEEDERQLLCYEHALLAAMGLLSAGSVCLSGKVWSKYHKAFGVNTEQHARMMSNFSSVIKATQWSRGTPIEVPTIRYLMSASSDCDFIQRMSKVLRTCLKCSEDPQQQKYPLSLRALIYAGTLSPLYMGDARAEEPIREEEVCDVLAVLRDKLEIPKIIEPFCRVDARLMSIDDGDDVERRVHFLKAIATALGGLAEKVQSLNRDPLTPEVKYMLYVLQELFEMSAAPISLLGVVRSDYSLLSVFDIFLDSCLLLPTEFLSVYVQVNGRGLLPPTRCRKEFLLSILLVFITCGVLRSFEKLHLEINPRNPPHDTLANVRRLGRSTRAYCELLVPRVPHAPALMLPGMTIVASHLLAKHWADALSSGRPPPDFADGLRAMASLLLVYSSPGVERDEDVSRVLFENSGELSWIVPIMEGHVTDGKRRISEGLQTVKAAARVEGQAKKFLLSRTAGLMDGLEAFVSPLPLVPAADDVVRQRLLYVVEVISIASSDIRGVLGGLGALAGVMVAAEESYIREYRALLEFQEKVGFHSLSVGDITVRLECLCHMSGKLMNIAAQSEADYKLVRQVVGAPAAGVDGLLEVITKQLDDDIKMLRDVVAAAIVRVQLGDILFDKFMKTDMRVYKNLKCDKIAVPQRRHLQREFPDVTMTLLLCRLEAITAPVSSLMGNPDFSSLTWSRVMLHFVGALFHVYFEESNSRFFCPEDWEHILRDLMAVETFIMESFREIPRSDPTRGDMERALRLLHWLQRIVRHCFPYPSTALVNGAEGVPAFAQLPPISDTTLWCKYVVRRVLKRRKDKVAKSASNTGGFFRRDASQ